MTKTSIHNKPKNRESSIEPPIAGRYTPDGDDSVEALIHQHQIWVSEAVKKALPGPELVSVVLMGGYGRGEGGFVLIDGTVAPYNDYDYFIVVQGLSRRAISQRIGMINKVAHDLEKRVGVEVDFAFLRRESLSKAPFSLMNAEMIWGHRVIMGEEDVLSIMPPMPFSGLGLAEFTRLMLNRGSLLLINQLDLVQSGESVDREVFVRSIRKAVLACGDARLAINESYHPSYVVKKERMLELFKDEPILVKGYGLAVDAKFHPDRVSFELDTLEGALKDAVVLWCDTLVRLEQKRLGSQWSDWLSYCDSSLSKGQGQEGVIGWPRHMALTVRDFGWMDLLRNPSWAVRYPRDRLVSTLPLLLTDLGKPDKKLLHALGLLDGTSWKGAAERFLKLWGRFS